MLHPQVRVRAAAITDVRSIADVYIRARRAAYAGFFPATYLDRLNIESATEVWASRLQEPGTSCFVAEDEGRIAGYVRFGPAIEDPATLGEVFQLHVDPEYWRRSIGSRLLSEATHRMSEAGLRQAVLYVYTANENARTFYEHEGWQLDGAGPGAERGGVLISQLRYRKRLSSAKSDISD